jgi:hypothetical protein
VSRLLAAARNQVREYVWEWIAARHGRIPPSRTCYGDLGETIVIRIDASLIDSHSEKERAAGTFKGSFQNRCSVVAAPAAKRPDVSRQTGSLSIAHHGPSWNAAGSRVTGPPLPR